MEWRKPLWNKSILMIGILFLVVTAIAFLYCVNRTDASGDAYENYVEEYQTYIAETVETASQMEGMTVFFAKNKYALENIQKTAAAYQRLLAVQPVSFDTGCYEVFFGNIFLAVFPVCCGILIAFSFSDRGKSGLNQVFRCAKKGRWHLTAHKVGALFIWAGILTAASCGIQMLLCGIVTGRTWTDTLFYPIQSLQSFSDCVWTMNIGQMILCVMGLRCIVLFLFMLLAWGIYDLSGQIAVSIGIIAVLLTAEAFMYYLISASNRMQILKYCNLWYLLTSGFFTEYRNLKFADHAVNKNTFLWIMELALVVLITAVLFTVRNIRENGLKKRALSWTRGIKRFAQNLQNKLTVSAAEFYKILISRKGILIVFLIVFAVFLQIDATKNQPIQAKELYAQFIEAHSGPVDDSSEQEILAEEEFLAKLDEEYENISALYEQGLVELNEVIAVSIRNEAYQQDRIFLNLIQEQTDYLKQLEQETGISGWYVNRFSYVRLVHTDTTLSDLLIVLGMAILASSAFYHEKRAGMMPVLKQSADRGKVFFAKIRSVYLITGAVELINLAAEITVIGIVYGIKGVFAPVQSIPDLYFVNMHCRIITWFFMVFLTRFFVIFMLTGCMACLSFFIGQKTAMIGIIVFCVPTVLQLVGIDLFTGVTPLDILNVTPVLMQYQSMTSFYVILPVSLLLGCLFIRIIYYGLEHATGRWMYASGD